MIKRAGRPGRRHSLRIAPQEIAETKHAILLKKEVKKRVSGEGLKEPHDVDRLQNQLHKCHLQPRISRGYWKISSPTSCQDELQPLAITVDTVHLLVCREGIEEITPLNDDTMTEAVATFSAPEIARRVMSALTSHWSTYNPQITRFRASIIHSLSNFAYFCPIVEWVEEGGIEAVAIFNIENASCYSWLAHYGQRNCGDHCEHDGQRWGKTWVQWSIESMARLRTLFEAAQNLAGVLQWSTKDIVRLYCGVEPEKGDSEEEHRHYQKLMAQHIIKIQQLTGHFKEALPLLENFCN